VSKDTKKETKAVPRKKAEAGVTAPVKTRYKADPELKAMVAISRILGALDEAAADRVLIYIENKFPAGRSEAEGEK
jgi:hypothetical protein